MISLIFFISSNEKSSKTWSSPVEFVLGLPIPEITLERSGASAVILSHVENTNPIYTGIEQACSEPKSDLKIFGKPTTRKYRRMGVALAYDSPEAETTNLVEKAKSIAKKVSIN